MDSKTEDITTNFNAMKRELLFKFLIVGEFGVGKTSIVRRYTEGKFSTIYKSTIGADFALKCIEWDNNTKINVQLWDIAGNERFGYLTRVYYKYAVAAAIVFDVTRMETFSSVQKWLSDLREKSNFQNSCDIPVILLANKSDVKGATQHSKLIIKFCSDNKILGWLDTSAKENHNIDKAMDFLINEVIRRRFYETNDSNDNITLGEDAPDKLTNKKACCG